MRNQRDSYRSGKNETAESKVAVRDEEEQTREARNGKGQDTGRTERRGESISLGNSNLHLFYYIIIPTRRSISGALKRRFSNRFVRNFCDVNSAILATS